MTVILDAQKMTDRASAHDYLSVQLQLPPHYGRNLDALYDVLTERAEPMQIRLENAALLSEYLGRYGQSLCKTLTDAAAENPNLTVAY